MRPTLPNDVHRDVRSYDSLLIKSNADGRQRWKNNRKEFNKEKDFIECINNHDYHIHFITHSVLYTL